MPELPEVETLRRGLERGVVSQQIVAVDIVNATVLKDQTEAEFRGRTVGATIGRVARRGKYLLLSLSPPDVTDPRNSTSTPEFTLCVHLKMRGQLLLEPVHSTPGPYLCVSLILERAGDESEGKKQTALRFYDMWRWGEIRALTQDELHKVDGLAKMGAEPLATGWSGAALGAKLLARRGAIKSALLDQSVVAGVGNIYAD